MDGDIMDEKYIELLLKKCIDLEKSKILFICYDIEIENFIKKLVKQARNKGIEEVYLDKLNPTEDRDFLNQHSIEELMESDFFDRNVWDVYAKKKANFLILNTEQPHLMDGIDSQKIAIMTKKRRESRPIYRKMVERCELSWCIAAYPGEKWAKEIFPNSMNSYKQLKDAIYKICMLDNENPIKSWETQLEETETIINCLNKLSLKKIRYQNS